MGTTIGATNNVGKVVILQEYSSVMFKEEELAYPLQVDQYLKRMCRIMKKSRQAQDRSKFWGPLPDGLKGIAILVIALCFIYSEFINDTLHAIILPILFGGIPGYFCGKRCYWWAKEINKNAILAFWIGFFSLLFGVFGYYLFYKNFKSEMK